MKEYNKLTKDLLTAGYTAENHPDYVIVGRSYPEKDNPLNNFNGGFEYARWHIYKQTFKTPCGLQCKGSSCRSSLNYMGIDWTFENDMPIVDCSYSKQDCKLKHPYLQEQGILKYNCNAHMVEEEYQYEGSVEGIKKLKDDEIRRQKTDFILQKNNRVCENHMYYDRDTGEWHFNYAPSVCARLKCTGRETKIGEKQKCPILGQLDTKKGNVYYDVKISGRRYELDDTLFEGQRFEEIKKGCRYFDHPVNMTICRVFANLCKDDVIRRERNRHSRELFFAEYHGRDWNMEVLNIRAEQKESRDLMQDLQDIRAGITITHASDSQKRDKKYKKERRQQAKEKRIAAMEKKILSVGYENMESTEQHRACRLLDFDRIDELQAIREEKLKKEQEKPVQLNLFDIMK